MLKKLYKLSVSTVQVMPLFPFLIWFSNSLPFAFFPFFFHQRSKHVLKSNCLYHLYLAYSHDFPMNFSSFYSWHLQGEGVKLPAFDPRHLSTSTTAGCDMSRCFERARARPGLAVMQRGKGPTSVTSGWKSLQEHPVWVTWGGCILNSPPNMAWTMYNDHITITISKYDSDFGCYAPQLGTLPKMPLFACQVQKSKGKCKMSHHWVII